MQELFWILAATGIIALLAWIGILTLALREKTFVKLINLLVAFAAGTLIAAAFIHLIPEAFHDLGVGHGELEAPLIIIGGFLFFFILEQYLNWHHCHKAPSDHEKTPFSYMILIADGIHNFVDGILVGAAFLVDFSLGIVTAIGVAAHEIPQELGNFGILVYGGWEKIKALFVNFLAALLIVPGGIVAYLGAEIIDPIYIIPFAAGGFIYIGAADLIPEIHDGESIKKSLLILLVFLLGIAVILGVETFVPHAH
ncbi:ZIP family metal transporter [Methanonatronarchaeum sp. AMET6-2]|uniref:ZIP family metal transporter n=1 Tax=Methanonatronarchaeum sp. AMET6-2 TaxID=2933293 RepID=UPI001203477F|nr:ZIP family metal transporter [Methanonatronarchaeum sp. AMET6-2]RZN63348.1 MAG: ZIP family metal transporter [Methanonatronarchaeia archaeon]UOY10592.1 ZIP family metal transporter [Methanonatronarchaeum sp. AMET6-2]